MTITSGFGPLKGPDNGQDAGSTSRAGATCVSTVGSVLPSTSGRQVGDLHTLTPGQTEYVLENVSGLLTWIQISATVLFAYDYAIVT